MVKAKRVHCNLMHLDAYVFEYEDGKIIVKCPRRRYCNECPFEKGIEIKRQRI
ncbi:hypothetical protein KEJ50_06300 [Candidatus Bathyarchaeota archaeon]|nr:hypothetical protein [Candidatus Bathyarchaeota archaeon]